MENVSVVEFYAVRRPLFKFDEVADFAERGVNQTQSNALGNALGLNRPDIQFTFNNKRYYIEIEAPGSNRGPAHKKRIANNDPASGSTDPLPDELKGLSVTINGKQYTLTGTITVIEY